MWLSLVVVVMNMLDRLILARLSFRSPDSLPRHDQLIDGFVDITLLGFTNHGLIRWETTIAKLNHIAQTWENIHSVLVAYLFKMLMVYNVLGVEEQKTKFKTNHNG